MSTHYVIMFILVLQSWNIYAQTQLTAYYGNQVFNTYSALNQGRITSFGEWECWVDSGNNKYEWKFRDWTSDSKTVSDSDDNYGNGNEQGVICQDFTLSSDDFIVGYTIYTNGASGSITGLVLNTRNGETYECVCRYSTSYTASYNNGTYDFWYLTGWNLRAGNVNVESMQFQFTKSTLTAPPTSNSPTTNTPTFNPTNPSSPPTFITSDPTSNPTLNPSYDPTNEPTIEPTSNPSQDPTNEPTS